MTTTKYKISFYADPDIEKWAKALEGTNLSKEINRLLKKALETEPDQTLFGRTVFLKADLFGPTCYVAAFDFDEQKRPIYLLINFHTHERIGTFYRDQIATVDERVQAGWDKAKTEALAALEREK